MAAFHDSESTAHTASPLGKAVTYTCDYSPDFLFPIARKMQRDRIGIQEPLPFKGIDVWNGYELSWLNNKGKPIAAIAQIEFPCESPYIVESKSVKLYLNSFNQTKFANKEIVHQTIIKDLSEKIGATVNVIIWTINEFVEATLTHYQSYCLDDLDIAIDTYTINPQFLFTENDIVEETLHSNLLKSNCLVTGQPDWATVEIGYKGKRINHEGLLRYIVSSRTNDEFAEYSVERIFMDILRICQPEELTVEARYTRRGGIDINPFRTTKKNYSINNIRLCRQ